MQEATKADDGVSVQDGELEDAKEVLQEAESSGRVATGAAANSQLASVLQVRGGRAWRAGCKGRHLIGARLGREHVGCLSGGLGWAWAGRAEWTCR
jgi:hypothetical protein